MEGTDADDVLLSVESLCTALKNIDRADIVTALEAPPACSSEEGACRLSNRDSALLSPSIINGKHTDVGGAPDPSAPPSWSDQLI